MIFLCREWSDFNYVYMLKWPREPQDSTFERYYCCDNIHSKFAFLVCIFMQIRSCDPSKYIFRMWHHDINYSSRMLPVICTRLLLLSLSSCSCSRDYCHLLFPCLTIVKILEQYFKGDWPWSFPKFITLIL